MAALFFTDGKLITQHTLKESCTLMVNANLKKSQIENVFCMYNGLPWCQLVDKHSLSIHDCNLARTVMYRIYYLLIRNVALGRDNDFTQIYKSQFTFMVQKNTRSK